MKTWQIILTLLLSIVGSTAFAAHAGTTLGNTNAKHCFDESLYVISLQGIRYCDAAISRDGLTRRDLAATYSNRGIINAGNGRYQRALRDHSKAISLKPDFGQLYVNRGNVYFHIHEYEKALVDYEVALATGGSRVSTTYFNQGLTFLRLKRIEDAVVVLNKAHEIAPNSKKIKRALASVQNEIN